MVKSGQYLKPSQYYVMGKIVIHKNMLVGPMKKRHDLRQKKKIKVQQRIQKLGWRLNPTKSKRPLFGGDVFVRFFESLGGVRSSALPQVFFCKCPLLNN